MKIVWRNPNPINRTSFSIVLTLAMEQTELPLFYRSSTGPGALGTLFELLVNRDAALERHDPNVINSGLFRCPHVRNSGRPDLAALASQQRVAKPSGISRAST